MAARLLVALATVCAVLVVLSSSTAQLAEAATAAQLDACNINCASACNTVGNAACPGSCSAAGTQETCTACKTGANNECIPQCTNVCYINPDPSIS